MTPPISGVLTARVHHHIQGLILITEIPYTILEPLWVSPPAHLITAPPAHLITAPPAHRPSRHPHRRSHNY